MNSLDFIASGKKAIQIELDAINALFDRVGEPFAQACSLILNSPGRVVVTGMGKSGHVGKKIAASLASTGTPSFFVHPAEAIHGDLGMITPDDIVIGISNSGNNTEILQILPTLKRRGIKIIAMTGNLGSPLAEHAQVSLNIGVEQEACPLNLAPTASTTTTMVMGDALVVALLEARGFTPEEFAMSHPGGKLGRSLLIRVEDIMVSGDKLPIVQSGALLDDVLREMTQKALGMTGVVNESGQLIGIYTDGDLRRTLQKNINIPTAIVDEHMTVNPKSLESGILAATAVKFMQDNNINGLFVTDKNKKPVGAFNMLNVLHAGL